MKVDLESMAKIISGSPWQNAYWFARMLVNGDKYGAVGTTKERKMIDITNQLESILAQTSLTELEKVTICKDVLGKSVKALFREKVKGFTQSELLFSDLEIKLTSMNDIVVFIITIKYILVPINAAMKLVPSNDVEFCRTTAKSILDSLGEENFGKVLSTWDDLGVKGCLDVERSLVVAEFTKLRTNLNALAVQRSDSEDNMVLTAFVQEFERRLGQKRKSRAGTSLEDVATFLFDYYGFTSHPKPDHFQTDIEVDKWFKCREIGRASCRERV